jgi:carnosine N-methyltransferase
MMRWSCPGCRADLLPGPSPCTCPGCGTRFPHCGGLPILAPEPLELLAAEAGRIAAQRAKSRSRLEALDASARDPRLAFRAEPFAARREGMLRNDRLAEGRLLDVLAALASLGGLTSPVSSLPGSSGARAPMEDALQYLYSDWGTGSAGSDVAVTRAEVSRQMALQPAKEGDRVLVIGAGVGRHAADVASPGCDVVAIDLALEPLWLCARLMEAPLEFALFQDIAPLDRQALTLSCATVPTIKPAGLSLAVADAARLPLGNATVSHIISVYFTDLLPLPVLLSEAHRVLRPGGRFLHVGPLHYASGGFEWHVAPDELPQAFAALGFQTESIRRLQLHFQRTPGCGLEIAYASYAFGAVRLG